MDKSGNRGCEKRHSSRFGGGERTFLEGESFLRNTARNRRGVFASFREGGEGASSTEGEKRSAADHFLPTRAERAYYPARRHRVLLWKAGKPGSPENRFSA